MIKKGRKKVLIVDQIKCVNESNENSPDDEIYLVIFAGTTVPPFSTFLQPPDPAEWQDLDTGDAIGKDVGLASTTPSAVYAAMLVEKDDGQDVGSPDVLAAWRSQTDLVWKSTMLALPVATFPHGSEPRRAAGFTAVSNALLGLTTIYMNFPFGNDDVLDVVKRVTITSPGQAQTIKFLSPSQGAEYDVTFRHNAA